MRIDSPSEIGHGDEVTEPAPPSPLSTLASRVRKPEGSVMHFGSLAIGGSDFAVIAGPCAVESDEQLRETASAVASAGARALRAGAYKPRTSPYDFPGLGIDGLKMLRDVGDELRLPIVTEVMDTGDIDTVSRYADALQVGARNMQNFALLRAVGRSGKPVLLKRGMAARADEFLLAAEYVLAEGNDQVVLCERGIRTFETATRNTLDLNVIPYLKQRTHLPVIVDPSHGTGVRDFVTPLALAAAACGADGVLVEVHHDPERAQSDGPQSLFPAQFAHLMRSLERLLPAVGRTLA